MTIEGISTDGAGVHLFSAEHRIDRINVTGVQLTPKVCGSVVMQRLSIPH